jgi:hypothetical protein
MGLAAMRLATIARNNAKATFTSVLLDFLDSHVKNLALALLNLGVNVEVEEVERGSHQKIGAKLTIHLGSDCHTKLCVLQMPTLQIFAFFRRPPHTSLYSIHISLLHTPLMNVALGHPTLSCCQPLALRVLKAHSPNSSDAPAQRPRLSKTALASTQAKRARHTHNFTPNTNHGFILLFKSLFLLAVCVNILHPKGEQDFPAAVCLDLALLSAYPPGVHEKTVHQP